MNWQTKGFITNSAIFPFVALLVSCAGIPEIETSSYPVSWSPLTQSADKKCNAIYGTYTRSSAAEGEHDFLVVANRLLKTYNATKTADRIEIMHFKGNPQYIYVRALHGSKLIEAVPVRITCSDGRIEIPTLMETGDSVKMDRPPYYLGETTGWFMEPYRNTKSYLYNTASGQLVMGNVFEECKQAIFRRLILPVDRDRPKCSISTKWYRLATKNEHRVAKGEQ